MRYCLIVLVALMLVAGACGGDSWGKPKEGSPGDALGHLMGYMSSGQWGRYWDGLHPAHQAIVDRDSFIACGDENPVSLSDFRVVETYDETLDVPELGEVATKAVTFSYKVEVFGGKQEGADTAHLLDVDGEWRWVLPERSLYAFRHGVCP